MGTLQNTRKAAIRLSEDKVSGFAFWPVWVVHFHWKLLLTEIQILQLLPLKQLQRQRGFGGKEGKGQTEIDYTSLSTHQPTQHYKNMDLHYVNKKEQKKKLSIQEESIPPKDTKQRGRYLENWLRFSHSSLSVNTVYNVYKITAQVMNGTQWASQSGVSSG